MSFIRTLRLILKQNLKKTSFYVVLLLMPLFTILLSLASSTDKDDCICIGFTLEGDRADNFISVLQHDDGLFRFQYYPSLSSMTDDLQNNTLECGYSLPVDLYTKLLSGQREGLITRYTSETSTLSAVTDEALFSLLFKDFEPYALIDFLKNNSPLAPAIGTTITEDAIRSIYTSFAYDDTVFSISFENEPDSAPLRKSDILFSPLKGILAHLILLAGLAGGLVFYKDPNHYGYRQLPVRIANILIPVLASSFMALLCLLFSDVKTGILSTLGGLCLYVLLVFFFVLLCTTIIKKKLLYAAFLPLYLLFSLLITPVFFDLTLWLPFLKGVSYLFIPGYYLRFF